ncbi:hypothetical protein ACFQEX_16860 [Roseibium salinum]|uniref:hypothetical protein n=1 Tax=Roseibium salinum TaxID=1604349 RepID=UPI00361D814D
MADGKAPNTSLPPDYLDRLLKILANLPKRSLQSRKVINTIVEFLRKVQGTALAKKQYVEIWDQIWAASTSSPSEDREISDPVGYAINDPAGKLTEDLLKYLWPKDAKVNGGISSDLANRLKKIVQRTDHSAIDASSVIVASRAEVLHAVAPEFTKQDILPLFRWDTNPSAAAYWSAFLWPARISPDLFKLLEADCLTALRRPDQFEERTYEHLCQLFLLASMEFKAVDEKIVREILDEIGTKGLEYMSSFLRHRMLNSKEDAASYWIQTIKPWIELHWPRDEARQSSHTRADFAMVATYSNECFPRALHWLENNGLLGETPSASTILYSLKDRGGKTHKDFKDSAMLPERFPEEVLHLLWITRPFQWEHGQAREILDRILSCKPELEIY